MNSLLEHVTSLVLVCWDVSPNMSVLHNQKESGGVCSFLTTVNGDFLLRMFFTKRPFELDDF